MDFFDKNLSTFFLKKYGQTAFNIIAEQIKKENLDKFNKSYIEIIFKIALYDFIGLNCIQVQNLLKHTYKKININVQEIKNIHKKSIHKIQEYLRASMKETLEENK